jgi:predicted Zn-dependent protease
VKAEADRIQDLLLYAKEQGADQCEVYKEESSNWNCRVYQGKVDDLQASKSGGLGMRLIYNNVMGTAYTTDLRWESMTEAVDRAIENAKIGHPDQLEFYRHESAEYPTLSLWDESWIASATRRRSVSRWIWRRWPAAETRASRRC